MLNITKKQLPVLILSCMGVAACSSQSAQETSPNEEPVAVEETKYEMHQDDAADMQPQAVPVVYEDRLYFEFDSADLSAEAKEKLDELAEQVGDRDNVSVVSVRLDGYADSVGTETYNMELSERRAQAVKEYLSSSVAKDLSWDVEGYGEQDPIASNDREYGRSQNRRVEVEISAKIYDSMVSSR